MRIFSLLAATSLFVMTGLAFGQCNTCGGGNVAGCNYGDCNYASSLWEGYCSEGASCCGRGPGMLHGLFGKCQSGCGGGCDTGCGGGGGYGNWWYGGGGCGCGCGCGLGRFAGTGIGCGGRGIASLGGSSADCGCCDDGGCGGSYGGWWYAGGGSGCGCGLGRSCRSSCGCRTSLMDRFRLKMARGCWNSGGAMDPCCMTACDGFGGSDVSMPVTETFGGCGNSEQGWSGNEMSTTDAPAESGEPHPAPIPAQEGTTWEQGTTPEITTEPNHFDSSMPMETLEAPVEGAPVDQGPFYETPQSLGPQQNSSPNGDTEELPNKPKNDLQDA